MAREYIAIHMGGGYITAAITYPGLAMIYGGQTVRGYSPLDSNLIYIHVRMLSAIHYQLSICCIH